MLLEITLTTHFNKAIFRILSLKHSINKYLTPSKPNENPFPFESCNVSVRCLKGNELASGLKTSLYTGSLPMFCFWTTLIEGKAYMPFLKYETVMEIRNSWHQFIKRKKRVSIIFKNTKVSFVITGH